MRNSPRVRDQPALTTSSGRSWLVYGGLLALIGVIVMAFLLQREPVGASVAGIIAIVVFYAVMIVARAIVVSRRPRLMIMAIAMICMAASALVCVLIVAGAQGAPAH